MGFREIAIKELEHSNVFKMIGKEWFLICAESGGVRNAMTASWGFLGEIWNSPCALCVVRPQRFTHTLTEASDRAALCFFGDGYRRELSLFGTKSGRDTDKAAECDFHYEECDGVPYFREAKIALICTKLYRDELREDGFVDGEVLGRCYPERDLHTVYIYRIDRCLINDGE